MKGLKVQAVVVVSVYKDRMVVTHDGHNWLPS